MNLCIVLRYTFNKKFKKITKHVYNLLLNERNEEIEKNRKNLK